MTYKVLSSIATKSVNSAELLKIRTDLLIIGVNKKTTSAIELKSLKNSAKSLIAQSIREINNGSRKSIFLPTPERLKAKNLLLIKEPKPKAASFLWIKYFSEIMNLAKSSKAKDFAFLVTSATPKTIDLNWLS